MPQTFDAFQYLDHLRRRKRLFAVACGTALGLALAAGLLIPKKYTAMCRVLVEPPGGADVRSATVVSPIYLESLRTYEHFAASDSLFLAALEHFHLRRASTPVESMKKQVLRVEIVRSTKILEIGVTLPDPAQAHAVALYLGEQTVNLGRTVNDDANRELVQAAEKQLAAARENADQVEAAWSQLTAREPLEGLQSEIESQRELKALIERELLETEADLAEDAARGGQGAGAERVRDARTRVEALRRQVAAIESGMGRKQALFAERASRRDRMLAERKAAQDAFTAAAARVREIRSDGGTRGERLKIIDPGIVPEKPSSPNLPFMAVGALLLGLAATLVYVTFEFAWGQRPRLAKREPLRVAGGGRDD